MNWKRSGCIAGILILSSSPWQQSQANPTGLHLNSKVIAAQNPWLNQLQAARQLLVMAHHDYSGHRSKASYEISAALHELLNPGSTATQMAFSKPSGMGMQPPLKNQVKHEKGGKAVSDTHLMQAAQILISVQSQIPPNQIAVKSHIQSALNEISIALALR